MKRKVIQTNDGSSSIYIPELDENYHSEHGAVQEAIHVFIENGLRYLESKLSPDTQISIFEMGFGTGLNTLLTAMHSSLTVSYEGLEAYPVEKELIEQLNYPDLSAQGVHALFDKIHTTEWGKSEQVLDDFYLKRVEGKIEEYELNENTFDLIYFDAFGPRAQSDMWQLEILKKMYAGLKTGGILVTYCAKGQFKRDLKEIGFEVESLPGPPGKREMTRATKV